MPDEAIAELIIESNNLVYDLNGDRFDAYALKKELTYLYDVQNEDFQSEKCDYLIKEFARLERNSTVAFMIVGMFYVAIIFVLMAMAILALKTLSGISDDVQKFGILYRLCANKSQQSRALFWQIFLFFIMPFALPLLLSIPIGAICVSIMTLAGYTAGAMTMIWMTTAITGIILAIYALYFTATYLIAKRKIVQIEL